MSMNKPQPAPDPKPAPAPKVYGLADLMKAEGYATLEELAKDAIMEIASPAICTACGYTTEMEPDQQAGWCEVCETNTVKAGLILAAMI